MRFFVKHPPNGDSLLDKPKKGQWDPFARSWEEKYGRIVDDIEYCEAAFEETSNPIHVIQAFQLAMEAGLYPPLWVMNFINDCFKHSTSNGFSLDRAFGFTRDGKGRWTPPERELDYAKRNREICVKVFQFEAVKLSRSAACDAVASIMMTNDGEEVLSAAAIRKILKETEHRYSTEKRIVEEAAESWTDEEKRDLFSLVDRESLPKKIRDQLRL